MGEKIRRENRKFKFETLQLHVGQENPDPATISERFLFIRALPLYFATVTMRRQDLI